MENGWEISPIFDGLRCSLGCKFRGFEEVGSLLLFCASLLGQRGAVSAARAASKQISGALYFARTSSSTRRA